MTFKEKLQQEHPECVNKNGTCKGCPAKYGYESTNGDCPEGISCYQCWNRKIPKTENESIQTSAELKAAILDACCEEDCPSWLCGEVGQLLNAFEAAIITETKADFTKKWDV